MGRLPVLIGQREDGYCVSFESFAYHKLDYQDAYELGPREIVQMCIRDSVYDDNGVSTTDIDLSGEVYICGDEHVIINFYPIYQTADGRIYLTNGNSMGMSGADGGSMTHTLTSDKTETIGGKSERVKVKVAITVAARATPTKFTVAHMDENDNLLKLEEFAPDALPESITCLLYTSRCV